MVIAIDAGCKFWSLYHFSDHNQILIHNFLYIHLTKNPGIAFGVDFPFIAYVTPLLIIGLTLYYFFCEFPKGSWLVLIGFASIIGGSIGNGWERFFYGEVTDFLLVPGFSVFNIADIAINIGVILVLGYYLFVHIRSSRAHTKKTGPSAHS